MIKNAQTVRANKAANFIKKQADVRPILGIILGSGLGDFVENIENKITIPYNKIPYFVKTTVKGHTGRLVIGKIRNLPVAVMQGRFHYYEGHSMGVVTFPVRVLKHLGIRCLFVTNAAGGINPKFKTGDFMIIKDHINLMGTNPLLNQAQNGFIDSEFESFINMTDAYDKQYISLGEKTASKSGMRVKTGVLAAIQGPIYETPAEIKMLRRLGADAVCMSTIPEVIMARALNLKVFGISLITNKAGVHLCHENVVKESEKNIKRLGIFLTVMIENLKRTKT
ncbi:MAG: hypothetical protein A2889_02890 [Nitrospinae bacterium RIFCSPLOWO2_01_FULL_39_10]|nr:MAG: hypothetical protein A2889_02890 [Nitrospinae bacterium RIFCSPLOWO2_01_FULL_39_10]